MTWITDSIRLQSVILSTHAASNAAVPLGTLLFFSAANTATTNWIDWTGWSLSVLGSLLGAITLIVAVWQLSKTRSAAKAASDAAIKTSSRIDKVLASYDLAGISQYVDESIVYLQNHNLGEAILRLKDLRTGLIRIQSYEEFQLSKDKRNFSRIIASLRVAISDEAAYSEDKTNEDICAEYLTLMIDIHQVVNEMTGRTIAAARKVNG